MDEEVTLKSTGNHTIVIDNGDTYSIKNYGGKPILKEESPSPINQECSSNKYNVNNVKGIEILRDLFNIGFIVCELEIWSLPGVAVDWDTWEVVRQFARRRALRDS